MRSVFLRGSRAWPWASLALCFLPTVPPAVNVTRSQDSEGMVHLTCKAFGFFPRNISVVWFQDEEPMSRDAQESGGVLPDGNGTYYTWETIKIPQGEEQRVKCIVEHSGNHSAHLAPLGKSLVHQRSWWIVSIPVVFIIGFCVYCYIKKRKTASATGRPGSPGHVLDSVLVGRV